MLPSHSFSKTILPDEADALPGRDESLQVAERHIISGNPLRPPFPTDSQLAMFGLGCFWGAERRFWEMDGVFSTMVGYAGGYTKNPTYEEVCSGRTAHNEVVRLVFEPHRISYMQLLIQFWQMHDPTQGMRQGNDVGTQYRSGIYCYSEQQLQQAQASHKIYQQALSEASRDEISSEIIMAPIFYFAEDYHQQYLAKNPAGYCGVGGTGVDWPEDKT